VHVDVGEIEKIKLTSLTQFDREFQGNKMEQSSMLRLAESGLYNSRGTPHFGSPSFRHRSEFKELLLKIDLEGNCCFTPIKEKE